MDIQNSAKKTANVLSSDEKSAARDLLTGFCDPGSFLEIDRLMKDGAEPAQVIAGYGAVDSEAVYLFAQDHERCFGAVGRSQAAKIRKIYSLAAQNGAPIVAVYDSDGAKLQEGIDAMDAVADILSAANALSGVVPQIAVILGGCVGSSALMAQAADVVIAVEGCDYRLNVGDEQIRADICTSSANEAMSIVRKLLNALPANNLELPALWERDESVADCADVHGAVEAYCDLGTGISLYDGGGICTAFGRVGGVSCGLVSLQGEQLPGEGCAAAARFVRLCDSFSLPIITFVDAAGFADVHGAAKISQSYSEATSAKITVIGGRAYGSVYIAVAGIHAGADAVLAWPEASIGPLAPKAAVCLDWAERLSAMKDPQRERPKLVEEYAKTMYNPFVAAGNGLITDVVTPDRTKEKLCTLLEMLAGKRVTKLPKKHANIQL